MYADFILAEQPSGMQRFDARRAVAADHRRWCANCRQGSCSGGASHPRVDAKRLQQRMIAGREDQPRWIREVREWEPFLTENPPFYEQVFGVRVPVDAGGMAGRTATGSLAKLTSAVIGRDEDAPPESLDALREMVAEILGKIPATFAPRPATPPQQIMWLYQRHWTRGAHTQPFPPHEAGGGRVGWRERTSPG